MLEQENSPVEEKAPVAERPAQTIPRGRESPPGRPYRRGFGGRRMRPCPFCQIHARFVDYKDADSLRRFVSDRGRIEPRRKVGTCAKHQRALSTALKRARYLALLPYTEEHIRRTGFFPSRY